MRVSLRRRHLGRRLVLPFALGALATGVMTAPVQASGSQVTIESTTVFEDGSGTFTADSAELCSSGTTSEPHGVAVREGQRLVTFELDKLFTCADGSGTFTLRLRAWWLPCATANRGVWYVVGGTGDYAELRGHGHLVGTYVPGPCDDAEAVVDSYRGQMRV